MKGTAVKSRFMCGAQPLQRRVRDHSELPRSISSASPSAPASKPHFVRQMRLVITPGELLPDILTGTRLSERQPRTFHSTTPVASPTQPRNGMLS
jgi:hypothetical protein